MIDGLFNGVGSVLSFLPVIVTLFFFLSMLEDSGYMARVAFVMDKLLRKIGLSGRSIVPMLVGFGCTEIVKAANFGQNPYKLSFAIQYRETSHSPSPPVESSYVQISPSQYTVFGQW